MIEASDVNLEKDLRKGLRQDRAVIKKAKDKIRKGNSITDEITHLKIMAEDIKASHLLLEERFRIREEEIKGLGPKAQERHRIMVEGYKKAIEEYLSLIDN